MPLDFSPPTSAVPLALVLRICALEQDSRASPGYPLGMRAVHHATPHRARFAFDGRHAPHINADGTPSMVLSLSRFAQVGVPIEHDYWRALSVLARATKLPPAARLLALAAMEDETMALLGTQASDYHEGASGAFALSYPKLFTMLPPVSLDRCWRETARTLKASPLACRDMAMPDALGVAPSDAQCVVWMVLPVGRARVPLARPMPGAGFPQVVALVVNNWAESDADLIDVPASERLTGAGSSEAVAQVVRRIQEWLDVAFYSRSELTPDREAREARAAECRRRRGFPDTTTVQGAGRRNMHNMHAQRLHELGAVGLPVPPDLMPPARKGRPKLPAAVLAAREAAAAEKRAQRDADRAQRSGGPGALAQARQQLRQAQDDMAALRQRITDAADALDTLPTTDTLSVGDVANGVRSLLDPVPSD